MDPLDAALVVAGLLLLAVGGELLVRGATGLAMRWGLSPLVVGLTVVSFATSAPELAVSLDAVLGGEPGLAVGNVVGSNIALVLLVVGVAALVVPLVAGARLVRLDVPVLVLASVAVLVMSLDGVLSRLDGLLLLAGAVVYTVLVLRASRRETLPPAPLDAPEPRPVWQLAAIVLLGVALLVLGARLLVEGAVGIATGFGLSGLVVGLTVVAIGTSVPELVTSLVAALRGERELALGNAVGSGIANICIVLGASGIIAPDGVPVAAAAVALDLPLMIAVAAVLLPIAYTGRVVDRWEGALFLVLYAAYTAYVLLAATEHDALKNLEAVMVWFTLPLVAFALVVLTSYEAGRRRGERGAATPG